MTSWLLEGGFVVGREGATVADVVIVDGYIAEVGQGLSLPAGGQRVDCAGAWVGPSFVDIHTHTREPGRTSSETIGSAARAAALGGYGAIVAMPNTEPALDSVMAVSYVLDKGMEAPVDVAVAAAITMGRQGQSLTPMAELAALGVRLFTDDGNGVQNALVMRRALEYASQLGVRLGQHCEDESLVAMGVMNESAVSSRLGLLGRPAVAEELMVMRDIELVRLTGGRVHFLHLSTARSLDLVTAAKAQGLDVTCEVAPHHFTLDETAVTSFDPTFKVHPPLRSSSDVEALRSALATSLIDCVATDHAPHAPELKELAFDQAPAGMLGLEHAASLTLEALGQSPDPLQFFSLLSRGPARIAQLRRHDAGAWRHSDHGSYMEPGDDANIVVFDPTTFYIVDRENLASLSTNTPYHGRTLCGRTRHNFYVGQPSVLQGELQ